ncbi:hypothetical protein TWF481_008033 [Arthrobotrys musiformis]|uniref:Uncharacterized protein n=1 Tax=Arthrobotrys musiformis TaxID=47236 RepID=A0AAV9W7Q7_9PEZI
MQLSKLAFLLPLVATVLAAAVPAENSGVSMATEDLNILDKRACKSNGCSCARGTSAGIYCGRCSAVKSFGRGGKSNDAYQCNSNGDCFS